MDSKQQNEKTPKRNGGKSNSRQRSSKPNATSSSSNPSIAADAIPEPVVSALSSLQDQPKKQKQTRKKPPQLKTPSGLAANGLAKSSVPADADATEQAKVVFIANPDHGLFEHYQLSQMKFDKHLSIYFETEDMFSETMLILRYNCPDQDCNVTCPGGWDELKRHVKKTHELLMCELCTLHKKSFTYEHTLFTSKSLHQHNRVGDPDDPSFKGHPECGFCRIRFYDSDDLFEHCRKNHEECFLCKRMGRLHQYYVNYAGLEEHFNKEHFPCHQPLCLERKFVVFASDIDLTGHELEEHADIKTKARGAPVTLNFDYGSSSNASNTRNGQGKQTRGNRSLGNNRDDARSNTPPETHDIESRQRRIQVPSGFGALLSTTSNSPNDFPSINDSAESGSPSIPKHLARLTLSHSKSVPNSSLESETTLAPTPAESLALQGRVEELSSNQQHQQKQLLERDLQLSGQPQIVEGLTRLFSASFTSVQEFKRITLEFRNSRINASEYLDGYMNIALAGKRGKFLDESRRDAGRIWIQLLEMYDESDDLCGATQNATGHREKGKKKKSMLLSEYENAARTMPKKSAMMRAWNDYKIKLKITQESTPSASVGSWVTPQTSTTPTPTPQVLVVRSAVPQQKPIVGMPSTSRVMGRTNNGSSSVSAATIQTPPASVPMVRQSSVTLSDSSSVSSTQALPQGRTETVVTASSFTKDAPAAASLAHRAHTRQDFPSLPTAGKAKRVTLEMLRAQKQQQQDALRASKIASHQGDVVIRDDGASGSGDIFSGVKSGKKKNKGVLLFHVG
ncbi:hypothetical protein BDV3_000610 [Batrachochytrium dendrobatidis]